VSVQSALRYVILTLALACCAGVAFSQDPAATTAQRVAREWLALTDAGNDAASWDAAAHQFKNAMTRDRWAQDLKQKREPLGALTQRSVLQTTFATSFRGAPDSNYAIVVFRTTFAKKADAVETVALERESDDAWRVVGYDIR
jgi:hypothetical protein